ncbi:hypothetical protein C1645_813057 [Glomus cerebriforme]|uniref:Uncharacterized protein n=1 Tax=Glomus cerebriforme TaxID=658196 RepID=A0A397TJN9_9GLOM|nr:hypothetical protein C1645_813057 [Glomus cerebriforme]
MSSCLHNHHIPIDWHNHRPPLDLRFSTEIRKLLHQYSSDMNFELDENGISWEIYLLPHRHKGLKYPWRVLRQRTYIGSENDPDVKFLLAEGMVIVEKNLGYKDVLLACSAPILQRTIENLPIQHIFTKKVLNKTTNEPSEYAFEAVFISILKQLLAQSYLNSFYHVLPEVKEYNDDSGDPRLHLDILLKDGFPSPAYGYELITVATKKVFDEHVKHAKDYSKLHNCSSMYLVHLCNNTESFKLNNYFGQECSNVTPVHVIYDKNNGSAKLIYKNDRTDLIIKSFKWKVIWGMNEAELHGKCVSD